MHACQTFESRLYAVFSARLSFLTARAQCRAESFAIIEFQGFNALAGAESMQLSKWVDRHDADRAGVVVGDPHRFAIRMERHVHWTFTDCQRLLPVEIIRGHDRRQRLGKA